MPCRLRPPAASRASRSNYRPSASQPTAHSPAASPRLRLTDNAKARPSLAGGRYDPPRLIRLPAIPDDLTSLPCLSPLSRLAPHPTARWPTISPRLVLCLFSPSARRPSLAFAPLSADNLAAFSAALASPRPGQPPLSAWPSPPPPTSTPTPAPFSLSPRLHLASLIIRRARRGAGANEWELAGWAGRPVGSAGWGPKKQDQIRRRGSKTLRQTDREVSDRHGLRFTMMKRYKGRCKGQLQIRSAGCGHVDS